MLNQLSLSGAPDLLLLKKNLILIYFLRESVSGDGADRETQNPKQALSTEPDARLQPTNREIKTWAEVRPLTDWATQAPQPLIYFWEKCRK